MIEPDSFQDDISSKKSEEKGVIDPPYPHP